MTHDVAQDLIALHHANETLDVRDWQLRSNMRPSIATSVCLCSGRARAYPVSLIPTRGRVGNKWREQTPKDRRKERTAQSGSHVDIRRSLIESCSTDDSDVAWLGLRLNTSPSETTNNTHRKGNPKSLTRLAPRASLNRSRTLGSRTLHALLPRWPASPAREAAGQKEKVWNRGYCGRIWTACAAVVPASVASMPCEYAS
jgi:hypothetical protein